MSHKQGGGISWKLQKIHHRFHSESLHITPNLYFLTRPAMRQESSGAMWDLMMMMMVMMMMMMMVMMMMMMNATVDLYNNSSSKTYHVIPYIKTFMFH